MLRPTLMPKVGLLILASILLPASAFAAGKAHGGPPPGIESIFWPVLNFSLYCWLISRVLRTKIRPALEMRARTIVERLNKAHSVLADADAELLEVTSRLEQIPAEKLAVIQSLSEEGKNISEEVRRSAEATSASIRSDVIRRRNRETEQAKAEIRAEVVRQATELARKQLEAKLSEQEDQRLREEAMQALF